MRKKAILIGAILFLIATIAITAILVSQQQDTRQRASDEPTATVTSAPSGPTMDEEEWNFIKILNDHRQDIGAGQLKVSKRLTEAAEWMSQDMSDNNHFPPDHVDTLERPFQVRIMSFGYPAVPMGENIAFVGPTGQDAFNAWLNSTMGHKEEMENATRVAIGIARVKAKNSNSWYWTADFGATLDEEITPTEEPATTATPTTGLDPTSTSAPTTEPTTQPTGTIAPSPTSTNTPTPTRTPTPTPTRTPTPTPTRTPTPTPTRTPTPTLTPVPTSVPSATPTTTPNSPTPTATTIPTATFTPTPSPIPPMNTYTPTPTLVATGGITQSIGIIGIVVLVIIGGIFLLAL